MANFPTVDFWRKNARVNSAATRGWNHLVEIPKALKEGFPDLAPLDIGFCSESEVTGWHNEGWIHLETKHFGDDFAKGLENFNQAIGLRYSLNDKHGLVAYKDMYLMVASKEHRQKIKQSRNEFAENYIQSSLKKGPSHPAEDIRGATTVDVEEENFRTASKPKGRPPKSRNN